MVRLKLRRILLANFRWLDYVLDIPDKTTPIRSLKPKAYRRIYEDFHQRGYGKLSGSQMTIKLLLAILLIGQIFRCLFLVFLVKHDTDMWNTWLGSYFALVNSGRKHTEIAATFFSIYPSLILALMLCRSKFYLFMKIIIQYGKQVFDPQQDMSSYNRKKLKIFKLPMPVMYKLYRKSRRLYLLTSAFSLSFALFVFIVSICSVLFGNYRNMNMTMFENSWTRYLYAAIVALYWAYWSFSCILLMLYIFYHFMSITHILKYKIDVTGQKFRSLHSSQHVGKKISTAINSGLRVQLKKEMDLFEEIGQLNQFWSHYITITNSVCTLMICYLMYLVLITDARLDAKIMFSIACTLPLTFLVVTTRVATNLYNQVLEHYKTTAGILSNHQGSIHPVVQLKILNTLDVISLKSIGFTYSNRTMIESNTLVTVSSLLLHC